MKIFDATYCSDKSPRVGLVNMSCDERGEDAFKRLIPDAIKVHSTRTAFDNEAYLAGQFTPAGGYPGLAASLPRPDAFDVIAFSCTSASFSLGLEKITDLFQSVFPNAYFTNPAIACLEAFKKEAIEDLAVLTPYPRIMHDKLPLFLRDHGFQISDDGSFLIEDDALVSLVDVHSFISAGKALVRDSHPDALFISCMEFDVIDHLHTISSSIGCSVFCSAQVFAWHCLTLLGQHDEAEKLLSRGRATTVGGSAHQVFS